MKKFYLIHGFESLPNRGFFPWLMHQLFIKIEACVVALEMPKANLPNVSEWVTKINIEINEPNTNIYLVGHSLGVPAVLRYLETIPKDKKIGGVFLVAGFTHKLNPDELDTDVRKIDNFVDHPFDFNHIKNVCNNIFIIHGEKDNIVPYSEAEFLGDKLDIKPLIVKDAGHFQSSKVFELPELLELILKNIK